MTPTDTPTEIEELVAGWEEACDCPDVPQQEGHLCPNQLALDQLGFSSPARALTYAKLLRACEGIYSLLESGELVRDTSHDHEDGYMLRQLPQTQKLMALSQALAAHKEAGG